MINLTRSFIAKRSQDRRLPKELVRLKKTIEKAAEFHLLSPGWYFGRGEAISVDAIESAINLVKLAAENGLWKSNVFPRVEGGVQVSLHEGEHEIEIAINPDTRCEIVYECDNELVIDSEEIFFYQALPKLREIARICTSEQSTPNILTRNVASSILSHANPQQMVVYLSSASNAQRENLDLSASIFGSSTKTNLQTQRFFGASAKTIYPLTQAASLRTAQGTLTLAT